MSDWLMFGVWRLILRLPPAIGRKRVEDLGVVALETNDDRLKYAPLAAIYRRHDATARRREMDAGILLIREHRLSQLDPVTLADQHAGLQVVNVRAEQGDRAYLCASRDLLFWRPGQRDIQSLLNFELHRDLLGYHHKEYKAQAASHTQPTV